MLHISGTSHNETKISGEFWDFDHLYFAIAYLTGDFGIHPGYHPYPELKEVCQTLLGLNHELREAERGNREISVQSNGLSLTMFAPVGHEDQVIPEGWTLEHHFGDSDFDLDAFEMKIWEALPEELDIDFYEDLSIDSKAKLLSLYGFDDDEIEEYTDWLREDEQYTYKHAAKDYPGCSNENTWISVKIPFPEAFLYALIIQLILAKKDQLLAYYKELIDHEVNNMSGWYENYIYSRMNIDCCRVSFYMECLYAQLYDCLGKESYLRYRKMLSQNIQNLTDQNISAVKECAEKYKTLFSERPEDKNAKICQEYLDTLIGILSL